jgi:hypothetical protein
MQITIFGRFGGRTTRYSWLSRSFFKKDTRKCLISDSYQGRYACLREYNTTLNAPLILHLVL